MDLRVHLVHPIYQYIGIKFQKTEPAVLQSTKIEIKIRDLIQRELEPKTGKRLQTFPLHLSRMIQHALREFEIHTFRQGLILFHE